MMVAPYLLLLVLLRGAADQDENLDSLRKSIHMTGQAGYAYRVKGRFEREGEVLPDEILTSRMRIYQSARHGNLTLIKGPEGLWKTADERMGEKTQKVDPDVADIVRTLQGAEAPHLILQSLLEDVDRGRDPEVRELDGQSCRRYLLYFRSPALRQSLEKLIDRAIEKKTLARPDEIRWSSSSRGLLRIYLDPKTGRLVRANVEQSVKIAYKFPDREPDVKTYRTDMELDFIDVGKAKLRLPPEIRERLSIKGD